MLHDGNASGSGISEVHRPPRTGGELSLGRAGPPRPGPRLCPRCAEVRHRDKARAAYQDFLTLWKDADPDIPILKQAKAEYAKLQ